MFRKILIYILGDFPLFKIGAGLFLWQLCLVILESVSLIEARVWEIVLFSLLSSIALGFIALYYFKKRQLKRISDLLKEAEDSNVYLVPQLFKCYVNKSTHRATLLFLDPERGQKVIFRVSRANDQQLVKWFSIKGGAKSIANAYDNDELKLMNPIFLTLQREYGFEKSVLEFLNIAKIKRAYKDRGKEEVFQPGQNIDLTGVNEYEMSPEITTIERIKNYFNKTE